MKTIITFGVFDMLHFGHVLLFKHAREICKDEACRLVVAVQRSETVTKYKPEANLVYNTYERVLMVESIRYVDEVVVYDDVDIDIQKYEFDIWACGGDQKHSGFQRARLWCQEHGKEVVVMKRTEGISSTQLRSNKN